MASLLSRIAFCVLASLVLVSCGDGEAEHRKAFIAFLEADVLSKPGVRLPNPSQERRQAFGDYAAQYDVITRYHKTMEAAVAKPMREAITKSAPASLENLIERRSDIEAIRAEMARIRETFDGAAATADRERAALKQPDDLAPVYDRAYDKLVLRPAGAVRALFPAADEALASALNLADLVENNRSKIKLSGSSVEIADPALLAKVEEAMNVMNAKRQAINGALGEMRKVMFGT